MTDTRPVTGPDAEVVPASAHALAARAGRRQKAEQLHIDAAYIASFIDRFYGRIRADALLGPIFAERITDWPVHLERMNRFWRSILLSTGEFAGNPMLKHAIIPGLTEAHFAHWLDLFYATLRELEVDAAATQAVGARARMIADSLLTGIAINRDGINGVRAGKDLPHV